MPALPPPLAQAGDEREAVVRKFVCIERKYFLRGLADGNQIPFSKAFALFHSLA